MLAARLYNKQDIRIEEVDRPCISANEILLKVKSSFICGTDIRMYNNGGPGIGPNSPLILGHELSGVIEEVGANVDYYKKSMHVAVAPNMGCGVCDLCVSGNTHLCPDYKALGINLNGAFAEYVRIPEAAVRQGNVIQLKESVAFKEAALAEPLSCVYNAFERSDIRVGDYVLIIGSGPIGIMHAKLAKAAGAAKVMINDLLEERLDMCRKADSSFVTLAGTNIRKEVMCQTNGKGVDVCITACPAVSAQENSLEMMAVNGRVIFFGGLPKGAKATLDTNLIHYKQLIVSGTTRASMSQFRKTLDLISEKIIGIRDLVSESVVLADFKKALDNASKGIGLKNEIVFNE
jgi:L-iditol 2-dehydrogenase